VATLADEGTYLCSESTMYRLLRKNNLLTHRQKSKKPTSYSKTPLIATGPNKIWSWDITYLKAEGRGRFYFLYLIVDIFSRKIMGWEVHSRECSVLASDLLESLIIKEGVEKGNLTIHSDNGMPMRSSPLINTLYALGVSQSFTRPKVKNDNAYSESLFRTLKYCPEYPDKSFKSLPEARLWVNDFVHWYNHIHKHSQIGFVTPNEKHLGLSKDILERRRQVYLQAAERNPTRFTKGIKKFEDNAEAKIAGYRTR
jgi:putative transposase